MDILLVTGSWLDSSAWERAVRERVVSDLAAARHVPSVHLARRLRTWWGMISSRSPRPARGGMP